MITNQVVRYIWKATEKTENLCLKYNTIPNKISLCRASNNK